MRPLNGPCMRAAARVRVAQRVAASALLLALSLVPATSTMPIRAESSLPVADQADAAEPLPPLTAILGAFGDEVTLLESALTERREVDVQGLVFLRGRLHARDVVLIRTGIGKVNAAMTTALLIDRFRPAEVVFTGIAGALDPALRPGDIVIGTATVQHDFAAVTTDSVMTMPTRDPVTGDSNPLLLPADERLRDLAVVAARHTVFDSLPASGGSRSPVVVEGIVATGDCFVAAAAKKRELHARLDAVAVEMEGAAVAQVCHQLRVPCIIIRSLSDNADERAAGDIERFYAIAAHNSARLVESMVMLLGDETAAGRPEPPAPVDPN